MCPSKGKQGSTEPFLNLQNQQTQTSNGVLYRLVSKLSLCDFHLFLAKVYRSSQSNQCDTYQQTKLDVKLPRCPPRRHKHGSFCSTHCHLILKPWLLLTCEKYPLKILFMRLWGKLRCQENLLAFFQKLKTINENAQ